MCPRLLLVAALALLAVAASAAPKRVALVFDDGPKPEDAGPLLAVLAREQVHVTFSLVGQRVAQHPETARAIVKAGHEVANHSQTHAHPGELADPALDREVAAARQQIAAAVGTAPRWYWPPFLDVDDRVRAAVLRAGLELYVPHHLVVSRDYEPEMTAEGIRQRATTDVRDGTVILFHEWRAATREQLPAILAELRRQGCVFLTFSGLHEALAAMPPLEAGNGPGWTPYAPVVPAGGVALWSGDVAEFRAKTLPDSADAIEVRTVTVAGRKFERALRVTTNRDLRSPWAVEAHVRLGRAVRKGAAGLLRFQVRAVESADETGTGRMRVVVQRAGEPFTKSLEQYVMMRGDWQEFLLPFEFAEDGSAGEMELALGFGFKREALEIGGIELLDFGTSLGVKALPSTRFTYDGREAGAAWRREALARIERVRRSDFVVAVRDAAGRPAAGATVTVEQVRSAFQFGSALQFARLVRDTPENLRYRAKVLELFNAASPENDLKWGVWEGEWEGDYGRRQTLEALSWLRGQGFHVRGHVLVWPGWENLPQQVVRLRGTPREAEIPAMVLGHIAEITAATRAWVQEWDVLNEPYDNHDLMTRFGEGLMVDWFRAAAAGAPGVPLYLNDYSNHDLVTDRDHCAEFVRVAQYLLDHGAPLGGLGLQAHIGAQPNPPVNVLAALDRYAQFRLPIRFTELDIDTDDEALQADYLRDFLILAYSHPSVVGVQLWGFWESAHWRPKSALFRADWSEKPAAQAYRSLVLGQWRTRLQSAAGDQGEVAGRGYHGDYIVTVERDGHRAQQTFRLRPEEPRTTVVITLP